MCVKMAPSPPMVNVELTPHLFQFFPDLQGKKLVVEAASVRHVVQPMPSRLPGHGVNVGRAGVGTRRRELYPELGERRDGVARNRESDRVPGAGRKLRDRLPGAGPCPATARSLEEIGVYSADRAPGRDPHAECDGLSGGGGRRGRKCK